MTTVEIRFTESISVQENEHLFAWDEDIFNLAPYGLEWILETDWHFFLYENGQLVSHVGVLKQAITVGEQPIIVGGIAFVITLPKARGKGYAHKLLAEAAKFMQDELKVEFGMLFCHPELVPFYQQIGWQLLNVPIIVDQPGGMAPLPLPAMVLPCQETVWPAGIVNLGSWPW